MVLPASSLIEDIAMLLYNAVAKWMISSVLKPLELIKLIRDKKFEKAMTFLKIFLNPFSN